MTEIPRLAFPVRYDNGVPAVVEQDSIEEIAGAVEVVLRTQPGGFDDLPEFGLPDPTFVQSPISPEAVASAVQAWEPRARLLVSEDPSALLDAVDNLTVDVEVR